MSSCVYYLSSDGRQYVSLDGDGLWIGTAEDLRSRDWDYVLGYRSLTGITRKAKERSITACFTSMEVADKLRALSDCDMAHNTPGWVVVYAKEEDGILIGGWRQRAFIVSSKPDTISPNFLKTKLTVTLLDGAWKKGHLIELRSESSYGSDWLDYPHDIPFDYGIDTSTKYVNNTGVAPAPLNITFYGAGVNPQVSIANNAYKVDTVIPENSYVEVKGSIYPRKIFLVDPYGDKEDIFDKGERGRGKGSGEYIFEEVPVGYFPISWSGASAVDVEWFEVEGEPPWS